MFAFILVENLTSVKMIKFYCVQICIELLLCLLLPHSICFLLICTHLPVKSSLTSAEAQLAFIHHEGLDVLNYINVHIHIHF